MIYGVRSGLKEHTKYWAEHEDSRIEFDIFDVTDPKRWENFDEKFHSLFEYIKGQLIQSDLTEEEYAAIEARRTNAEKKAIEERIRSGR